MCCGQSLNLTQFSLRDEYVHPCCVHKFIACAFPLGSTDSSPGLCCVCNRWHNMGTRYDSGLPCDLHKYICLCISLSTIDPCFDNYSVPVKLYKAKWVYPLFSYSLLITCCQWLIFASITGIGFPIDLAQCTSTYCLCTSLGLWGVPLPCMCA
jgi:hypothetical protein